MICISQIGTTYFFGCLNFAITDNLIFGKECHCIFCPTDTTRMLLRGILKISFQFAALTLVLFLYNNCAPMGTRSTAPIVSSSTDEPLASGQTSPPTSPTIDSDGSTVVPFAPVEIPEGLMDISQLQYKGAFRLNNQDFGDSNVNYAIGTLAYNPDRQSIYIAGHSHHNAIAEFSVPELGQDDEVTELPIVNEPLSNFRAVLAAGNPSRATNKITGMMVRNNQLIINSEIWYDGSGSNDLTTLVVRDLNNFETSEIDGYFKMEGRALAAGYISAIPRDWESELGVGAVTGWSYNYSINSRYSIGPSLFTFDANALTSENMDNGSTIATEAKMAFPFRDGRYIDPGALGNVEGGASPMFNQLSKAMYGFIVPKTRTFAVIGRSGGIESGIGYKIDQDNGSRCAGYCSRVAGDQYNYYWLFNMDDILNAENTWDPRPYAYGPIDIPFDKNGEHGIIGASYDIDSNQLFLALGGAGQVGRYDRPPLIVVYTIQDLE